MSQHQPTIPDPEQGFQLLNDLASRTTDLLGAVSLTQGEGLEFQRIKVHSDSEGSSELVVAGISLADTG
jgi:hypothetical protein